MLSRIYKQDFHPGWGLDFVVITITIIIYGRVAGVVD